MGAEFAESVTGVAVELTREPIQRHTAASLAHRLWRLSQEMAEVSAELALAAETWIHQPEGDRALMLCESRQLARSCGAVYALGEVLQTAREIDATGADCTRPQ